MTQLTTDPLLHTDYTALPAPVRHSAITPALFGLLCLNMVATAFDVVLWVRFIKTMKGFSWFVSQALYPVSLALVLGPMVGWRLVTGRIAPSNFSFPKALLLLLAGCGVAQNRLMTAGGEMLSGPTQSIIGKAGIGPLMLLSMLILGARYTRLHLLGAVLVLLGVALQVYPEFQSSAAPSMSQFLLGALLLIACLFIPKTVLEEKFTKLHDLDIFYTRFYEVYTISSLSQNVIFAVLIGVVLIPLAFVRIGDDPAVQPAEFGTYMHSAVQCFSGQPDPSDSTQCNAPWVVWIGVIAANATHDLCTIAIAKYTSAATESLWASAALILTNILFLVPTISGQPEQSLSLYTAGSVCVVCAGLAVFSWEPEVSQQRTYTLQVADTDDQMRCHKGVIEENDKVACATRVPGTT